MVHFHVVCDEAVTCCFLLDCYLTVNNPPDITGGSQRYICVLYPTAASETSVVMLLILYVIYPNSYSQLADVITVDDVH